MREIAVVAKDGKEFLLGANNFIPWRPVGQTAKSPSGIRLEPPEKSGVRLKKFVLYDRTDPPPVEHSAVMPRMFDGTAFDQANAK